LFIYASSAPLAGWLATVLVEGDDGFAIESNMILGVAGAFFGVFLSHWLLPHLGITAADNGPVTRLVLHGPLPRVAIANAMVGAVMLLLIVKFIRWCMTR
jgi:uncharacterized membrane protein YeaQ/YmgE (transglycosylase-associated protein family)